MKKPLETSALFNVSDLTVQHLNGFCPRVSTWFPKFFLSSNPIYKDHHCYEIFLKIIPQFPTLAPTLNTILLFVKKHKKQTGDLIK